METKYIPMKSCNYIGDVGKSYYVVKCPFCGQDVITYAWSVFGVGKKCTCGAKIIIDIRRPQDFRIDKK